MEAFEELGAAEWRLLGPFSSSDFKDLGKLCISASIEEEEEENQGLAQGLALGKGALLPIGEGGGTVWVSTTFGQALHIIVVEKRVEFYVFFFASPPFGQAFLSAESEAGSFIALRRV